MPFQQKLLCDDKFWVKISGADPKAYELYNRHYSKYWFPAKDKRPRNTKFTGPGQTLCLATQDYSALFVWLRNTIKRRDNQYGINCTIFRNEGPILSSLLILEAEQWARERWGNERLFTYINPYKINSKNPGYCFKKAGWRVCGKSKIHKLIIMEKLGII